MKEELVTIIDSLYETIEVLSQVTYMVAAPPLSVTDTQFHVELQGKLTEIKKRLFFLKEGWTPSAPKRAESRVLPVRGTRRAVQRGRRNVGRK